MSNQAVEVRNCMRCEGKGTVHMAGFTASDGTVYADKTYKCSACNGEKTFTAPDGAKIIELITTGRGVKDGKRKLRASWSNKTNRFEDILTGRAYYVWRMARFHGGKDVTMPFTAGIVVSGDPFRDELDAMSELVAKKALGTDMAGALRWGQALGVVRSQDVPQGLPDTAYEGGPEKIG